MADTAPLARAQQQLFEPVVDRYGGADPGAFAMALKSYRYLRLAMIMVMVALGASVLKVRNASPGFEQSISAYYYTPVRSVFVAALVSTGVALTVIKGRTLFEDWCLGIAGVFAPVIAFVPTTPADSGTLSGEALAAADNNIFALLAAGWVSWVLITVIVATKHDGIGLLARARSRWASVVGMLVLLIAATAAFSWWSGFVDYAHGWSAAAMFAALGLAAVGNGLSKADGGRRSTHAIWYVVVGVAMLGVGALYMVTSFTHRQWDHEVLHVEVAEIALFVVFWIIQSIERWNWTVTPAKSAATIDLRAGGDGEPAVPTTPDAPTATDPTQLVR